ncbi:GcrA family cell cycle regulator [Bradyrhizobium sp. ISRA443]|uniref:GcrA family cell cycle regulator n=1 Tax=unclassified Bradyrhizobium TaxID=2631580 RepID=UPI00247857ED|nr:MULTISPECIES: GcrA family cell cycle regulator [unclassified Bradyrhizobium]WGR91895.1 GcrA family cell cycle regulator [Bradyrhizobium sp. ISRA435]WGS02279.1 GcrA family cell cycle regulator [Bradyrhizobium sp. ISRA436]WGS09164.1 GcrA family cell cycle regulator [Bradyrhizobium sp. ISRA437]WGS16053.1 GcrA family cell cycle regulator [Bradyrhizobium sp. ISRA443]
MIAIEPTWTPERVEQLKSYFAAGLSCRDIAVNIGVSRNAVIGKLSRLNLTRTTPEERRARRKKSARAASRATAKRQLQMLQSVYQQPADDAPVVSTNSCSLFELSEQRCRWPISTPGADDFCFCGNTPLGGMPYCAGHYRLAYQLGPRQRAVRG